jgi:hypothetical protein
MAPGGLRAGNLPAELTSFVGRRSKVAAVRRLLAESRLVISQRTAEGHVQHILTKLGFTSRAQVAAWVAASQPDYGRR